MIIGYHESSLGNSESYMSYKNNPETPEDPFARCKKLIETAKHLTEEDIEPSYIDIKQYSNSLSRAAVRAFDTKSVILLYNTKPNLSMIQLIPFMTLRKGDKYITYVFVDRWVQNPRGSKSEDTIKINSGILHDLLVGSLIANSLKADYSNLTNSDYMKSTLMMAYCQFFCRILNRDYGLGADKILYDTVQYCINRFFLVNIFGASDDDSTNELAKKHFKYIDPIKTEEIKTLYNNNKPFTVSELLNLIKGLSPRMNNLTRSVFITNWMNYYKAPAYLGIDNVEYLIFMITSIKRGSDLINARANDIVNEIKGIKSFEAELLKLVKDVG